MKRRFQQLAAILMVSVFMVSGCGTQKPEETKEPDQTQQNEEQAENTEGSELSGKITLQIASGQKLEAFEADAKEFMDAHPGTEIEVEFVEKIETIQSRMASQDLPDICQVPKTVATSDMPQFYLPIDEVGFTADNIYFYDKGVVDGKLYSISPMANFSGIVYSKKAFEKAGIQEIPKTMDEFYAACEKLKAADIVPFATNYKDKWPLGVYAMHDAAIALSGDPNYNNSLVNGDVVAGANLELLEFLKSVVDKGYAEPDLMSTNWGGFTADIATGKYGMTYLGSWFPPQTTDVASVGMFPFPGAKGVTMSEDFRYGISKNTESPELALAYYQHLFLDGVFNEIMDTTTPMKGVEYKQEYVKELLSYGVPAIEAIPDDEKFTAAKNAFAADGSDMAQEYILADDVNSVITKYNEKWNAAKSEVE